MRGRWLSSLRLRLMALVLIAVVPAFALIVYTGLEERTERRGRAEAEVELLTQVLAGQQGQLVEGARQLLTTLAGLTAGAPIDNIDPASCSAALAGLIEDDGRYANIGIARADGMIFCSALPIAGPVDASERTWFRRAVASGRFATGDYQIGTITGKPTVNFGYPVAGADGNTSAVIFAALDLSWLNQLAAQADLPEGAAVTIVDRSGTILARYPEPDAWVGKQAPEAVVEAMLGGVEGTGEALWADGVNRLFAFSPLGDPAGPDAFVSVGVSTDVAFGAAERTLARNLALLGVAAALALAAAWFVGGWFILRGVNALVLAARRLGSGDLSARANLMPAQGELGDLGRSFDQMAQALEQRQAEQREAGEALRRQAEELARSNAELEQFAYVASHDLQEPLRMVSNYTQLLARRYGGRLDGDADEFIAFAVDGAARMQQLINDLLSFSRVGTRGAEPAPVDAGSALERALLNLTASIDEAGAQVTAGPLPAVMADEGQLSQLFQNLIGNAIKFRGAVAPRVHVSAREEDGWCVFSVRDNGIGVAPEYAERIFVLFQRLHGRADYPGTGIGLAICKKIVERHGGRIWVESGNGSGAVFCFTLPAARLKAASRGEKQLVA